MRCLSLANVFGRCMPSRSLQALRHWQPSTMTSSSALQVEGASPGKRGLPNKDAADAAVARIRAAELQVHALHMTDLCVPRSAVFVLPVLEVWLAVGLTELADNQPDAAMCSGEAYTCLAGDVTPRSKQPRH